MKLNTKLKSVALASVAATALASGAFAADGLAFSPLSLDIPALKGLSEGVKHVGGGMGYDVVVLDPKFDPTLQQQQLLQLIETGRVKSAWVISVNPGAMGEVIDAAQRNGVVLVVNGLPQEYGLDGMTAGVTFANIDYADYGGSGGDLAAQCANEVLGGTGKALVFQNKEGVAGKEAMETAMAERLAAGAPGVEVVSNIIATERADALNKVSQVLQANPDINVVISVNDEGGLGALGAFEAAGKEIPCLVDLGGNDEVIAAVEAGDMYGAVALNFGADLMQTFEAIKMMSADPSADGRQQFVPLDRKVRQ